MEPIPQWRPFALTSHYALHRPGCPNLLKLKVPPIPVDMSPGEIALGLHSVFVATCCAKYGGTREVRAYVWEEE